jgi:hypothetical protein
MAVEHVHVVDHDQPRAFQLVELRGRIPCSDAASKATKELVGREQLRASVSPQNGLGSDSVREMSLPETRSAAQQNRIIQTSGRDRGS